MNWFIRMFNSSLGRKLIMALTGLFLCAFLVVHVSGNLQLFHFLNGDDQGLGFNSYTVFMTSNPLIMAISYMLYATVLFHAFKGFQLAYINQKRRPVKYAVNNGKANSHWTSRNMGILGTVILVFLVVHMGNFWYEYKFGHLPYSRYTVDLQTGELAGPPTEMPAGYKLSNKMEEVIVGNNKVIIVKDLYKIVVEQFKNLWLVVLYVLSMFAVSFHLYHGFKSAFQSIGISHVRYNGVIKFIGIWIFAIAIPVSFALMPIYFFFRNM